MNRGDLIKLRKKLNFEQFHIGELLNYAYNTEQVRVSELERGKRPIGKQIERILQLVEFVNDRGMLNDFMKRIGLDHWIICPECDERTYDSRTFNFFTDSDTIEIECQWCGHKFPYTDDTLLSPDLKKPSCVVL